jgi:N,N'-diacetyllegionaminate synthase
MNRINSIEIGGHRIGRGHPCFLIAEAGVNHNGDPAMAEQLVLEAKRCGADCVKFQTFSAERLVTATSPKAQYQLKTTDPKESQLQMLKKIELPAAAHREIFALAKKEGIICISTPYNVEDITFLAELEVPALKIASGQIVEPHFLECAARTGLPLILSTGMATMAEISTAVECIQDSGNQQLLLLQCTTNYPSRIEDANLRVMKSFERAFGLPVGYSDHTEGLVACFAAVSLGASLLEKHFTLDRSLPGPDHACSSDPGELLTLAKGVRQVEAALGTSIKCPTEMERRNALGMRRSIVAKRDIPRGTPLSDSDLTFKRPMGGMTPSLYRCLVGRKTKVDIAMNAQINWDQLD